MKPSECEFRWIELARTFPCLAEADERHKWSMDPRGPITGLLKWLRASPSVTSGGYHAGRFMLGVWNHSMWKDLEPGDYRFDAHAALNVWDDAHLRAFQAFVRNPWYT